MDKMPSLSIYVNREIYDTLSKLAGKESTPERQAKKWIEERYAKESKRHLSR
jgi:hypothetical protein